MADDLTTQSSAKLPYFTVLATLATLFLFAVLVVVAYYSPNYLGDVTSPSELDPATKSADVKARNQAVLDGLDPGVKMSVNEASARMAATADQSSDPANPRGRLPFPVEPMMVEKK